VAAFVLKLTDIDEGGKSFSFDVTPAWIDKALSGSDLKLGGDAPGSLAVHAQKTGGSVLVRGRVQTSLLATCVRCLGDARLAIDAEVTALLSHRDPAHPTDSGELELTPEDLTKDFYTGDQIVLDELVREQILLECPMNPLCAEDCPGIEVPAHLRGPAGATTEDGKPIDPRLLPLQRFARNRGQKE
jgi:uncharacterized protein